MLFPSTFSVLWPLETESNGWEKGHGGSVDLRVRQHILTLRNVQSAAALDQVDVLFQSIKGYTNLNDKSWDNIFGSFHSVTFLCFFVLALEKKKGN